MKNIKFLIVSIFAVGVLGVLGPIQSIVSSQSSSDSGSGLSISPTRTELQIEAGATDVVKLNVRNVTSTKIIAKVFVNDFTSDDDTGEPRIIIDDTGDSATSIKSFISGLVDVELEPGEDKSLDIDVNIPENTPAGAYYGVIRYASIPADSTAPDAGQVSLTASVGSIVLIEVPGDIREQVQVRDVFVYRSGVNKTFFTSKPDEIGIRISNQGNGFAKPFGNVNVTGPKGDIVSSYELNNSDPRANVLPESSRTFRNPFDGVKMPGRYTVTANVSFSNGGEVLIYKKNFWYVPVWVMVLLVVLILGLALVTRQIVKTIQKRKK